jgi:hypothetical protein
MAQFNVPEFGGSGQWMRGGMMTAAGDMFNNSMKATIDNLCSELSNLLASQAAIFAPAGPGSQSPGAGPAGDKKAGTKGAPQAPVSGSASEAAGSVLALVEQLARLKEKGILTEEEFTAKKAELLKRL